MQRYQVVYERGLNENALQGVALEARYRHQYRHGQEYGWWGGGFGRMFGVPLPLLIVGGVALYFLWKHMKSKNQQTAAARQQQAGG